MRMSSDPAGQGCSVDPLVVFADLFEIEQPVAVGLLQTSTACFDPHLGIAVRAAESMSELDRVQPVA